jgi:sulfatase maturation enzyme AslB (radical SAM superfamily)
MKLNEYFSENVASAIQLFSSGWCNLNCKYCFIPKTDFLKKVHSKIIERIKNGDLLKELKEMMGEDLDSLSHWGTEPTLTLSLFKDFYKEAVDSFPKLNNIHMSSNFMTPPKNIINFVNEILPKNRKLNVSFQISLDGPEWITDKNRLGGSTNTIVNNVKEVISNVEDFHNISFTIKSTITKEIVRKMCDKEVLVNYYDFFEDCLKKWIESIGNKKITISQFVNPTLVVPDNYTQDDGISFLKMIKLQFEIGNEERYKHIFYPSCFYFNRWVDKLPYYKEYFTKPRMFSCSSGDSCFGFGDLPNTLYGCHRSYYTNYPEYENEVKKWNKNKKEIDNIEAGRNEIIVKTGIADINNKKQFLKMLYVNRGFQDFIIHRTTIRMAAIHELACCNQISPIYKNKKFSYLFSTFLEGCSCQLDNVYEGSTMEASVLSTIRMFGNGAFEFYVKKILGRI